jgi:hypothetical protein
MSTRVRLRPLAPDPRCGIRGTDETTPLSRCRVAERAGFEPAEPFGSRALQARALDQTTLPLHVSPALVRAGIGIIARGSSPLPDLTGTFHDRDTPQPLKRRGFLGHARRNRPRYAPTGASHPKRNFSLMHGSAFACGPSPHNRQTEVVKEPHRVCAEAILLLTLGTPGRIAGQSSCHWAGPDNKPALSTVPEGTWLAAGFIRSAFAIVNPHPDMPA